MSPPSHLTEKDPALCGEAPLPDPHQGRSGLPLPSPSD